MKVDFIWKIFPIVFIEKPDCGKTKTYNAFLFVSYVQDLNDKIQIEQEKVSVRNNYIFVLSVLITLILSYNVNIWLTLIMGLWFSVLTWVLYFTDVGEYRRDVVSFRKAAKIFAKQHEMELDVAYRHYANIMINSGRYDKYTKFIGEEKIIDDLRG